MESFRIGDVARLTGVSVSTLRLWEQHGLVTPDRSGRGQRLYSPEQLQQVYTIMRLRRIEGLNMSAIKRVQSSAPPQEREPRTRDTSFSNKATRAKRQLTPTLAGRFRAARAKLGMSLKEASELSGLPISFISTFERTNRGATVASLQKLAECYQTTVTELSGNGPKRQREETAEVILKGKEEAAPQFHPGITILQLATALQSLDCQKWILAPGARSEGAYSHAGEEFIHVLKGQFLISVDGAAVCSLGPGDSISFESRKPHMWLAADEGETEILWINTPKSY